MGGFGTKMWIGMTVLGMLCFGPAAEAKVLYVTKTGNDAGDGLSWATAKLTVQGGLNAAASGDQVWVAAGTYVERITLKLEVELYGGFIGSETDLLQRDRKANTTILDGDQAGSVVTAPSGATATTRIDGFTIRNGQATSGGGGVYCSSSSPTIANNTIGPNYGLPGGGIYCENSSPTITANFVTGNRSMGNGGGVYCFGGSPTIINNKIIANAAGVGGGIYCKSISSLIANNTITGNNAKEGGGIDCFSGSTTIVNNTIVRNGAGSAGGGIDFGPYCSPTLANTIIAFNSSGLRTTSSTVILRSNCIYGNTAFDCSGVSDPTGIDGNISADPRLPSVAYGNLHIQPDSSCKDTGDDTVIGADWLDMDGQARTQGNHVDIGADETDGTAWPTGPATIVRVSPSGNDANDGSSWSLAKRTVQAGIAASATLGGDVWVQAGTYLERITLLPYTHVLGGFAGTETRKEERRWSANLTILDGQQGGSVVTSQPGFQLTTVDGFTIRNGDAGNGGGVYCHASSPTIANNRIIGNFATLGGGVFCMHYSSPTMANNLIIGNGAGEGGGIWCESGSPLITNNTITANSADEGGGILSHAVYLTVVNTIVAFNSSGIVLQSGPGPDLRSNCVFGNAGRDYGDKADPTGTNGNISVDPKLTSAAYGDLHIQTDSPCKDAGDDAAAQAAWLDMDGQPRIQGTHVDIGADESDDTAWPAGPRSIVRVSPDGDDTHDGSSWSLAKRTIQAGVAAASSPGGEVWVQAGTYLERITLTPYTHLYGGFAGTENSKAARDWAHRPTIIDGQQGGSVVTMPPGFLINSLDGFTIRNGKATHGGGIYCHRGSSPSIPNNTIIGNRADFGGGIYCDSGASPAIANNRIVANGARGGGGVYCYSSRLTITNSTITGNGAPGSGGGIWCSYSTPTVANTIIAFNSSGVFAEYSGTPTLRSSCVFGNAAYNFSGLADPTGANGNISADPRLASAVYGDVHIQPDSPCRDAGDDAFVTQAGSLDMDGQMRTLGNHVDMGADESNGEWWPAGPCVVVRVGPDGNDANDGSSWPLAKRTVQAGITAASRPGGEVWVRAGTYPEPITLPPYVHLYGGFTGIENARQERDWSTNRTILDGQQAGSVVTAQPGFEVSTIDGFMIRNGNASDGGGINCSYSSLAIVNNLIIGNKASGARNGGGIYCTNCSPKIHNNTITANTAGHGGGVFCESASPTIIGNRIAANTTTNSVSRGGGIYCYYSGSSTLIANNAIVGNSARSGGGIACLGCAPMITNNTVCCNNASVDGGAINCRNTPYPTITNTIVAFNSSGIFQSGTTTETLKLGYNCVYGNSAYNYSGMTDPAGTGGNLSADPKFVGSIGTDSAALWGTDRDDYSILQLRTGSPCIDAGDNTAVPTGILTDVAGRPRLMEGPTMIATGQGTPPIVDMGAFETLPPIPGDLDLDDDIDLADLKSFRSCMSGAGIPYANQCGRADFDKDGDVDLTDFAMIQRCFSGVGVPGDRECAD